MRTLRPFQSVHGRRNKPVQIYARLVLLPRFPLSKHLVHYLFVARESVPWKNVKPAQNQHAHAGPHRHLSPAASRQHLPVFLAFCRAAQNKRILVSLLPLETITQSTNGVPKLVHWCAHPSGNPVLCQRGYDGAASIWLWFCGAVRGALQESTALPSEHHREVRILGILRSYSLCSLRPAMSQPGGHQHRASTSGCSCRGLRQQVKRASPIQTPPPTPLYSVNTSL